MVVSEKIMRCHKDNFAHYYYLIKSIDVKRSPVLIISLEKSLFILSRLICCSLMKSYNVSVTVLVL